MTILITIGILVLTWYAGYQTGWKIGLREGISISFKRTPPVEEKNPLEFEPSEFDEKFAKELGISFTGEVRRNNDV